MKKKDITSVYKGLHTDTSHENQPKDSISFGLNVVNRSSKGNYGEKTNEQGNKLIAAIPDNFTLLNNTYISEELIILFSVSNDELVSEIGEFDPIQGTYKTIVNDMTSPQKLGFKLGKQIDSTYRLRRGCEHVVYWTDGENKLKTFNFGTINKFKHPDGTWNIDKFLLIKIYRQIPSYEEVTVQNSGNLPAGSYNFSVQYLDEDLNPSEWIFVTDTVIIYKDSYSNNFQDIRGSTNEVSDSKDFGLTNKSIHIKFGELDRNYLYYRVAVIKANNGSGQISEVVYTDKYSTQETDFIYTGAEDFTKGTIEEISIPRLQIETAEHIDQNENMLLLANTKGKQINWCKLQKYASKVQADVALKEITLDDIIQEGNPKRGEVHFEAVGLQPGEIYSYNIHWVFDDGYVSPGYHIPGKSPDVDDEHVFNPTPEQETVGMRTNNQSETSKYIENPFCSDFWGVDSEGNPLEDQAVRHHRLPLRSEANLPLLFDASVTSSWTDEVVTEGSGNFMIRIHGNLDPIPSGIKRIYFFTPNLGTIGGTIDFTGYNTNQEATALVAADIIMTSGTYPGQSFADVAETEGVTSFTVCDGISGGTYQNVVTFNDITFEYYRDTESTSETVTSSVTKNVKKSKIMGVQFSNIEIPTVEIPEGENIVGYYITRAIRTEADKTILDTGIMHPTTIEKGYVALGHLNPASNKSGSVYGLIHPEHKFKGREYEAEEYIIEGHYSLSSRSIQSVTQDVMPGTSYDPEVAKKREEDHDGYSLHTLSRLNTLTFRNKTMPVILESPKVLYLNALSYVTKEVGGLMRKIYNVSSDNKTGVMMFEENQNLDTIPYVTMRRTIKNPYSNYRTRRYYIQGTKVQTEDTCTLFTGDSYISSMRYTNTMFYDVRLRKRETKSGLWNTILGILSVIGGVALAATGNAAQSQMLIGFGLSQVASGIKKNTISKTYQEEYDAGLRDAVNDGLTDSVFGPNPEDDEIQWFSDHLTNVWFESGVNMNWRMGNTVGLTDFLNSPQTYQDSTSINTYIIDKLTTVDSDNNSGRLYQGFANAEIYEINKDYLRRKAHKPYYLLPAEYDCCSDCLESFPQRIHYSAQSFQEEMVDNFRVFLPNNYRDINGDTGVITDIFTMNNSIYVHTENALWNMPKNYQERVTGVITSFIGTGSFFEIPPQKILDDDKGSTAGCVHKWATLNTPQGVFFVCEKQRKIFQFNGKGLKPISSIGMDNFFRNNLEIQTDKKYLRETGEDYPYANNPSNLIGTGYISAYDALNERIIFTKKDDKILTEFEDDDSVCISGNVVTVFKDMEQVIADKEADGWVYVGKENCQLNFEKVEYTTTEEEIVKPIPNNTDIVFHLDTSGSFDLAARTIIRNAIQAWKTAFMADNPDWTGNVYYNLATYPTTEHYLKIIDMMNTGFGMMDEDNNPIGPNAVNKDVIVVSFVNENFNETLIGANYVGYHEWGGNPSPGYGPDYNDFLNDHAAWLTNGGTFQAILYPLVFNGPSFNPNTDALTESFLNHAIRAIEGGGNININWLNTLDVNPLVNDWDAFKNLIVNNSITDPYPLGLKNYGWSLKTNRGWTGVGDIVTKDILLNDINEFIEQLTETVIVSTTTEEVLTDVVLGEEQTLDILQGSWTLSYDFKEWVSFHSYIPNMYIQTENQFYSFLYGNPGLYKHNVEHLYNSFYGRTEPFIIETVIQSKDVGASIFDSLQLYTKAFEYSDIHHSVKELRYVTFNKMWVYNSNQMSGELILKPKEKEMAYMMNQIKQSPNEIKLDRADKEWNLNSLRDFRVDYEQPIFSYKPEDLQDNYFTDKVINESSISFMKSWTELQPFKDKYLVVRLIFDNFDNVQLFFQYIVSDITKSVR